MKREFETKIKPKVSNKVAIAAIGIASLVSLSLIVASLITPAGGGNFYSGSGDPPPPTCPVDTYANNGKAMYKCVVDSADIRHDCISGTRDGTEDASGKKYTCTEGVCCLVDSCPSGTKRCGDWCCQSNQTCESVIPLVGPKYCDNNTCISPKVEKNCGASRKACCDPEDGCAQIEVFPGKYISACVPPNDGDCTDPGESLCKTAAGEMCCSASTTCVKYDDKPMCVPQDGKCKADEKRCTGDFGTAMCCKGTCFRQGEDKDGNGIPDLPGCKL